MQSVFLISFAIILLDRITKGIAVHQLKLAQSIPVVKDIFHITLVYNKGAAFGILQSSIPLFIIISVATISFVLFLVFYRPQHIKSFWMRLAVSLILGGAIGNLIDRIRFGYVIDFLDFRIWPVFNIADSAITVGILIIFTHFIRGRDASHIV